MSIEPMTEWLCLPDIILRKEELKYIIYIDIYCKPLIFQSSKVIIEHIESRKSKKSGAQFEILIKCFGSRDRITSHVNSIRMITSIIDVTTVTDQDADTKGNNANINVHREIEFLPFSSSIDG